MSARSVVAPVLFAVAVFGLTGCDKLKDMLAKNQDAGFDAGIVDAAPVVAAPEDAGVDAAPAPVIADDIPGPADEEAKANRDIGFGNFKEELDKLEKEPDKKK